MYGKGVLKETFKFTDTKGVPLFRYTFLTALLALVIACSSYGAGGNTDTNEENTMDSGYYTTPDGVVYSIYEWRYTNAIRPGGELELCFQCYNLSADPVDGPTVFGESTLSLVRPDGLTVEPEVNPLGIWDGPAYIEPGNSFSFRIIITDLFDFTGLGDYVVRWDVAGGTVEYPVKVTDGPEYYLYRLENDNCYNEWGIHIYGEDGHLGSGLAREAVSLGDALVPGLFGLLDDTREGFIEGSEDATIASMYAWRVCDYAAIMLIEILGQDPGDLTSMNLAVRDERLKELKTWWAKHEGEYQ
jgi:hypothetical protein